MTKSRPIVQYWIIVLLSLSLSACLPEEPSDNSLISGSPPVNAVEGLEYSFRPTKLVTGGNASHFIIINKPAWTSFDATTGYLRGTPDDADVGTYNNIGITATDGITTTSLPSFSITVDAWAVGTATLSWIAPTERVDNRPLIGLAGFRINYGQTSGIYNNKIAVQNPGITSYLVENLPPGTWHFVISAFDSSGRTSEPTNERSIAIP